MLRVVVVASCVAVLVGCGPKPKPVYDGGEDLDAGADVVDAGRARGEEPPTKWTTVLELPAGAAASTRLGVSVASAPDQFNQPLLAAVYDDPNGDGAKQDNRVVFSRWSGADARFQELKTIEVVGDVALGHPHRQVSVARDAVTGRIGVAYVKGTDAIRLATSDDEGANFSIQTISNNGSGAAVNDPAIALRNGVLHLAYVQGDQVIYRKRVGTTFGSDETAPLPAQGASRVFPGGISLALDEAGSPGAAYFVAPAADNPSVVFWRPGSATATVVGTAGAISHTDPNLAPSASLTFVGGKARMAFHLRMVNPLPTADNTPELSFAAATDDAGTLWGAPIGIPRNGDSTRYNSTRWYQALATESSGKVSVAADFAANGIVGTQCGGPKLARSDNGTLFLTCSPAETPFNFAGDWISLWNHAPGKLTMIFFYDNRANLNAKPGIVMWREP